MEEIWRDIEGYEGFYQVSTWGRVRSLDRIVADGRTSYKTLKGKIIKETSARGYRKVRLTKDGKQTAYFVHRLVAQTFVPNPENKAEVDHTDTNPGNNRVENLRWATRLENNRNSLTRKKRSDGLKGNKNHMYEKYGKDNPNSKAIFQITKDGNILRKWIGISEAARQTGARHQNIVFCCQGKLNSSGGFRWIYASELDDFLIEKMKRAIEKRRTA